MDKAEGKVQNTVEGAKDKVRNIARGDDWAAIMEFGKAGSGPPFSCLEQFALCGFFHRLCSRFFCGLFRPRHVRIDWIGAPCAARGL